MELCLAVSPGELTRAEQKILDYHEFGSGGSVVCIRMQHNR